MFFENRTEAGQKLAQAILKKFPDLRGNPRGIVLALPRGGVPVGFEIAKTLKIPLDLIVTHKLGAPDNPEFAIGAVTEDASSFIDPAARGFASKDYMKEEIRHQLREIQKRIKKYRAGRPLQNLRGKIVILVDDGIATGHTMKAAIALTKNAKAGRIIIAVPVLPKDTLSLFKKEAEIIYLDTPWPFFAIGRFYRNFEQLTDDEVRNYLSAASK